MTERDENPPYSDRMYIKYLPSILLFLCCFYFIFTGSVVYFNENIATEINFEDAYRIALPSIAFCRNQGEGKEITVSSLVMTTPYFFPSTSNLQL